MEYFALLTANIRGNSPVAIQATVSSDDGTAEEIFANLRRSLSDQNNCRPCEVIVMHWSLTPNQLEESEPESVDPILPHDGGGNPIG